MLLRHLTAGLALTLAVAAVGCTGGPCTRCGGTQPAVVASVPLVPAAPAPAPCSACNQGLPPPPPAPIGTPGPAYRVAPAPVPGTVYYYYPRP
jgi:hypothetical protein